MSEEDTLSGRIKRYGQVSKAIGNIATQIAKERLFQTAPDRSNQAKTLRQALGNLKGPLMKVAQFLTTIPDLLPPEYTMELSQLQANAPAMGILFVKRRMQAELGAQWPTLFKEFNLHAQAAASLGQVHQARSHSDRLLACKLQYPDMRSAVEADLRQLKVVLSLFERYDQTIQTRQIQEEISARLREELDYSLEAKHLRLYRHILAPIPSIHVPEALPELSTQRLLTMTWLDGQPLTSYIQSASLESRNQIAMNMFRAWYTPFYYYGVIHGDPHLGNYTVAPDHSINLLDFGCIRLFSPALVSGVIDLYHALCRDDQELAIHAYRLWGFKNLSKETIEILNLWARFIYAPLMEDRIRKIEESNSPLYGRKTAYKVHENLRRLGGVEVPRAFVFMDRAAIGLGGVFLRLQAQINWYQLFQELIHNFDRHALQQRQTELLTLYDLPIPAD